MHAIHKESPHPDIYRISNDENFGFTKVGRNGWHIDGIFLDKPHYYSMLHIISPPKIGFGQTAFMASSYILEQIDDDTMSLWNRLYMIGFINIQIQKN